MKRETKVGMVVAGSFLSVVGGYLGLRWRNDLPQAKPEASTEVVATEPLPPTADNWPTPKLESVSAPQLQPTATPTPVPAEMVVKPSEPVITAPAPVLDNNPPTPPPSFDFPGLAPQPVIESPKPEPVKQPEPKPVVQEVKPPEPELPKPQPTIEFKSAEVKQDPPKVMDPPPAAVLPIDTKPIVPDPPKEEPKPIAPPKEEPKPIAPAKEEPKPITPPAGTAMLNNDPPRPLPDPLPNLQPTSGTKTPKAPVSDSYLEEEYRLQAGDTFASVSKRFYMSDKYAMSLQKYNRDYPIGSQNLKQDPPRLAAGTVVWIPPIRVLEKRYPELIADYKPLNNNTAAAPATATAPTWTSTPTRQVAATTKTYRVQDGGESMIDIARKKLNNPQAWNTIYQMNPSLNANANAPIPAGTILRVPGDARD